MDTSLDTLKRILKQEIGLDASTVGDATIKKFLNQRMRACNISDSENYYTYLQSNSAERVALLETAVIPETWFFRDIRPFVYIQKYLLDNPLKYISRACNILSIPCSTGEEPYSLAMFLLQAGIPATTFNIQAVDISQHSLDIARQGCYGKNSFRGRTDQIYLDSYFSPAQDNQFTIHDQVRQCITFRRVNILDANTLPFDHFFDFVLCRNLLIYFDAHTKSTAFNNLHHILKDDGKLFIGHSEFGAVPKTLFTNTGLDNAFALIKYVAPPVADKTITAAHQLPELKPVTPVILPAKFKAPPQAPAKLAFTNFVPAPLADDEKKTPATPASISSDLVKRARQLADQGQLQDAEQCCLQFVDQSGDHHEVFFLLALINESTGKINLAENFYRKAIYLEPKHYESLIHLALLLEKKGDAKGAQLMRQRAERTMRN